MIVIYSAEDFSLWGFYHSLLTHFVLNASISEIGPFALNNCSFSFDGKTLFNLMWLLKGFSLPLKSFPNNSYMLLSNISQFMLPYEIFLFNFSFVLPCKITRGVISLVAQEGIYWKQYCKQDDGPSVRKVVIWVGGRGVGAHLPKRPRSRLRLNGTDRINFACVV